MVKFSVLKFRPSNLRSAILWIQQPGISTRRKLKHINPLKIALNIELIFKSIKLDLCVSDFAPFFESLWKASITVLADSICHRTNGVTRMLFWKPEKSPGLVYQRSSHQNRNLVNHYKSSGRWLNVQRLHYLIKSLGLARWRLADVIIHLSPLQKHWKGCSRRAATQQ